MTASALPPRRDKSRKSRALILGNYVAPNWMRRHRRLCLTLLTLFAAFYGVVITLFGTIFLLQLTVPLLILVGLVIWLLPATDRAPTRLLDRILLMYLFALLCWPDYLALSLPGLPWITAIRLVGVPLSVTLLLCVSLSPTFRARVAGILSAEPLIWKGIVALSVIALLSIGISSSPGGSANKYVVMLLNWVAVFFIAVHAFSKRGRVIWFGYAIWGIGIFLCLIGVWETINNRLPWAGRIPWFLKVEDEAVLRILAGAARAATGLYRTQSKFTTSLGFAEFLSFMMPFVIHIAFTTRSVLVRTGAIAMIPFVFWILIRTDSRLGMVGFFMSFMLYLLGWGIVRWRSDRTSLLGPAVTIAYPVIFAAFITATFMVGRLRAMVWGTGAHAASTETREQMYATGFPIVMRNPLGHGLGEGAAVLGFRNGAGVLTIDTYYLAIALELGVLGFLIYYGVFLLAIAKSGLTLLHSRDRETLYLLPILIALCNFVIGKSVLSQVENHPLVFMLLGMAVALLARARNEQAELAARTKGAAVLAASEARLRA